MAVLTRVVVTFPIDEQKLALLRHDSPQTTFVVCTELGELPQALIGAQVLIGGTLTPELLAGAPDLRWLQFNSVGVTRLLTPELVEHDLIITNYRGAQASNMAEHVVALMHVFARGLPQLIVRQQRGEWTTQPPDEQPRLPPTRYYARFTFELNGQTLAIAGLGAVGRELAWRAKGIGMRVIGLKRLGGELPAGVDQLYGPDNWREMLPQADHVAICLPLTARTDQLFGAEELRALKPGAHLYNISRGGIIDQTALSVALQDGTLAGAGLDVTTPEPLPSDSPLWQLPNVLITCHTSGASPLIEERGFDIIRENLRRYRQDEQLLNVVDKREGY